MLVASIDWTNVLEALIAGLPAIIASLGALLYARESHRTARQNQQDLQTPSGDPIGHVTERAHDLAAVTTAAVGNISQAVHARGKDRGDSQQPLVAEATGTLEASVHRLNDDAASPVRVADPNGKEKA